MEEKTDEALTVQDIADMSVEEVLDELLFDSYFTTTNGPVCRCYTSRLTHFLGMLPDKLCGQNLDEVDLETVPEFETKVSSLCPCQRGHWFDLKLKNGELTYDTTTGQVMDKRRIRLPNL
jgi:hypothetical protein